MRPYRKGSTVMTPHEAEIWNAAIKAACQRYEDGIGAIRALRIPHVVTVEHVGTTSRQDVWKAEE